MHDSTALTVKVWGLGGEPQGLMVLRNACWGSPVWRPAPLPHTSAVVPTCRASSSSSDVAGWCIPAV